MAATWRSPGRSTEWLGRDSRLASGGHLLLYRPHQPRINFGRDRLRLDALVDLYGLLGGVEYHEAVRALTDVDLQLAAKFDIHRSVQVITELLQKLFTGKQKRRPLSV